MAEFLFEQARVPGVGAGKGSVVRDRADKVHPALQSPDDALVVAGGPAGGFGIVAPSMGRKSQSRRRLCRLRAAKGGAEIDGA